MLQMNFRLIFQYLSYLQYPLMIIGLYFFIVPYLYGIDALKENPSLIFSNFNFGFIFMGLGLSFSSLQDTTKTQNKFSLSAQHAYQTNKEDQKFNALFKHANES